MNSQGETAVSEPAKKMAERIMNDAEQQREEILRGAQRRVQEIRTDAAKRTDQRRSKLVEQGKREIDILHEQELIRLKGEHKRKLNDVLWSHVDSVIQEALSSIYKLRDDETRYAEYVTKMIENGFDILGEKGLKIEADKRDEALVKRIISKIHDPHKDIEIAPDITTAGGIMISTRDGLKEVDGTMEGIVRSNYSELRERVFTLAFGDMRIGD